MRRFASVATATVVALSGLLVAAPSSQAGDVVASTNVSNSSTCDASGDGGADDCIRHRHHRDAADQVLTAKERLSVRVEVHPTLHGKSLRTQVQVRPLDAKGKPSGAWGTAGSFSWEAEPASDGAVRKVFTVCAPQKHGFYQVRKVVEMPKPASATRAAVRIQPLYTSAPSTVQANAYGCTNSPDDEVNVEYFNEVNFNELFMFLLNETTDDTIGLQMSCPEPLSPEFPPASLEVLVQTTDQKASSSCRDQSPILLEPGKGTCDDRGTCNLVVLARNNVTSVVYSQTFVQISLAQVVAGQFESTLIPSLEPATLPICNNTLNPCLLDATCSLSTEKPGSLELCESATDCTR